MKEVSLEQRERDYNLAEQRAMEAATRWMNARVRGPAPADIEREMDEAQGELGRARRRLEETRRRLAKRKEIE